MAKLNEQYLRMQKLAGLITEEQLNEATSYLAIKDSLTENKTLNESPNSDMINRNLKLLDKAADMAIKNPKGNVTELAKIIKKYTADIRKSL